MTSPLNQRLQAFADALTNEFRKPQFSGMMASLASSPDLNGDISRIIRGWAPHLLKRPIFQRGNIDPQRLSHFKPFAHPHLQEFLEIVNAQDVFMSTLVACPERKDNNEGILHLTVREGDLPHTKLVIYLDHEQINLRSTTGVTPVHLAAAAGNTAILYYLLNPKLLVQSSTDWPEDFKAKLSAFSAAIDLQDHKGMTALYRAAINGHVEAAAMLLNKGASLEILSHQGMTAADVAAYKGYTSQDLLQKQKYLALSKMLKPAQREILSEEQLKAKFKF